MASLNILDPAACDAFIQEEIPLSLRRSTCIVASVGTPIRGAHQRVASRNNRVVVYRGGYLHESYVNDIVDDGDDPLFNIPSDCCGLAVGGHGDDLLRAVMPVGAGALINRVAKRTQQRGFGETAAGVVMIPYNAFEVPLCAAGETFVDHIKRILGAGLDRWCRIHLQDESLAIDDIVHYLQIKVRYTQFDPSKLSMYDEGGSFPWCVNICVAVWGYEKEGSVVVDGISRDAFLPEHELYLPLDPPAYRELCANIRAVVGYEGGSPFESFDTCIEGGSFVFEHVAKMIEQFGARRARVWAKLRRILLVRARFVGWLLRTYAEVTLRPGRAGALLAQEEFEGLQNSL